ncbi:MAG: isochorismatase family protein [Pirellulales bacterium]|nr:isochorismatase family protein [Pirellulales bacterium]
MAVVAIRCSWIVTLICLAAIGHRPLANGAELQFAIRDRVPETAGSTEYRIRERDVAWQPRETAIVICDMWNQHWCASATRRVAEMAPVMNEVLAACREAGVLIVHAPSDCLEAYAGTPQRKRAQAAPVVQFPRRSISVWGTDLDAEPRLPIDDSDGGCDCQPQCKQGSPWRSEIAALEIGEPDAISDSGPEILNLFQQQGIKNVVVMGVHTNMCVLGRSFGLRQMARAGLNVVLARDLTDTMYNPRKAPHVAHHRGTQLVIEHIEKFVCPSIDADDLVGEPTPPAALFMIGEDEYDTKHTLPEYARQELIPRGWRCTFVQAVDEAPQNFPGLEGLAAADVLVLSVRRRTPTVEQLAAVRAYLEAGKPLVAIRTASHAFDREAPEGHAAWPQFDDEVLGANYERHYGNKPPAGPPTIVQLVPEAIQSELLAGMPREEFPVTSHLYRNRDLGPRTRLLMWGRIDSQQVREPLTWTNTYRGGRVFYTSLGNPDDFQLPAFRDLLRRALYWAIERSPQVE